MTTPPEPPAEFSWSQMAGSAPPRKSRVGLFVGLAAGVLVAAALGAGAVLLVAADKDPTATGAPAAASPSPSSTCPGYGVDAKTGAVVCKAPGAADIANQGPTYATPKAGDFTVTVKILEKQCFGSAGCNITYRIDPQYTGAPLDPSVTWLVTYEVFGVEDSPQVNTFEVTGDEASFDGEEFAQTKSSKAKLTVKVTEILRG